MEEDKGSSEIEGTKVLSVCFEGHRIFIKNIDLDMYQMLDLHRDAKRKFQQAGIEVPQYFGFMFCGPIAKRKLPLDCDNDWLHLSTLWEKAKEPIPIYMPSSSRPSCSHPINTTNNVKSSQLNLQSLEDINVIPKLTVGLDDKNEEESGNNEDSDDDVGSEVGSKDGSEYSDESFVNSDEVHDDDVDSDIDQFLHPTLQDDIPKHIDVDDDGMASPCLWNKVYQSGSMWTRDLNGKVSIKPGDMFLDKKQWVKVLRDYTIQEGICLKKVKNDRLRHIVVCKEKDCEFKVHTSRLGDGKTWQIKTFRSVCKCARDAQNNMASYRSIAEQLLPDFKANPDLQVNSMIQLCMKRVQKKDMLCALQQELYQGPPRQDPESYAHEAYTVEKYKTAYDVIMKPITDLIFWENSDCPRLSPPKVEVKKGRPPSERRRDGTEKRKRSHREGGTLFILRGKDKPSYKSKIGSIRKMGRPPKQASQASNDVTSQASTSPSKKGKKRKVSICHPHTSVVKRARKGKASI
ncbi:hypothetical protein Cgig2_005009 [Carnegiea gigantea]|uniref:Transposase MuDR plant domain-containing protein n=1 Tax=Carnegiea gigantea TaxID=171969 RepID=A0A9Q1L1B2_9CARY|nr:hypothetical protein Cgig2_005009 [Carnegiea gigantea]